MNFRLSHDNMPGLKRQRVSGHTFRPAEGHLSSNKGAEIISQSHLVRRRLSDIRVEQVPTAASFSLARRGGNSFGTNHKSDQDKGDEVQKRKQDRVLYFAGAPLTE